MRPQPFPTEDITVAAVDMIRRTGCAHFELRYSEPDEQTEAEKAQNEHQFPIIWIATAHYIRGEANVYLSGAALNPTRACLELLETVVDGGMCTWCKRPTGLEPDSLDDMPMSEMFCWFQYDPETKRFRPGCGGEARAKQENPAAD